MKAPLLIILLGTCLLLLGGCGPAQKRVADPVAPIPAVRTPGQNQTLTALYAGLAQWQGVPHRDGGLSKKGVDCSGFTFVLFRDLFNTRLPRTTSQLARTGDPISRQQLQSGDLFFFKISQGGRHVGIYLEGQKFIHASKSTGVMMSRLDNPYWLKTYWQARRVASL